MRRRKVAKPLPPIEYLHECFTYHEDGYLIWKVRPERHFLPAKCTNKVNSERAGKRAGTYVGRYVKVFINGQQYQVHRIIWTMHTGIDDVELEIDHHDNDRMHNRFGNLRQADRERQNWNRSASLKGSGFKGVSWHPRIKKWQARVGTNGKRQHLGYFDFKNDALAACAAHRAEMHGEYANDGIR